MEEFIHQLLHFNFWSFGKFFILVGLGVYLVFSFVVVRQVKLMTQVVSGILTNSLRVVAWLLFLFSIIVFIFTLLFF
ncbi:MAG TPA: DUF5657 family protein [Patescibacteria group bacterium]|nr:DUF5657 family protein [Patescibacteria group bacterium]